jgi:hypothetical protein
MKAVIPMPEDNPVPRVDVLQRLAQVRGKRLYIRIDVD